MGSGAIGSFLVGKDRAAHESRAGLGILSDSARSSGANCARDSHRWNRGGRARALAFADLTSKGPEFPGAKLELKADKTGGAFTFDTRTNRLKALEYETALDGIATTAEKEVRPSARQKQTAVVTDKNPVRD